MLSFWTFLAGAKRWFNADFAKAVATVLVVLILCITAALFWGKAESAGGAKRDVSWLKNINRGVLTVLRKREADSQARAAAAVGALAKVEAERDEAVANAAAVAAALARLQDDPVCYTRDLVKEMNR